MAVAAAHALDEHGLKRVAVVDFDVHHGNGTEDIFRNDPRVMLEGGYELHALGRSAAIHLKALSAL